MQNGVCFEASQLFEFADHAPEDEATDDEKGHTDDEESPTSDFGNICVVKFHPILRFWIEIREEVVGEAEVHDCGEAERAEEEKSG